ncbi:hypothetical protein VB715_08400 [Crocosphaera sp. UHCC 0190]|uniref:hypothetical protein n=1 Tax=Crocosphaera sp. UHCC 0190 TaxID=3110246 RepID=UPI002B21F141|nr:hypothetical protein [Crocosphaera sp. UHCC 0190]MEA5509783.1 hypothetical protein [Crocosphaera sp. UHCC 0190]
MVDYSILQTTELVKTLKKDQPNLLTLNTWFRNNFDDLNIQVQAFCEQQATPLNKTNWLGKRISEVVVDCNSADPKLSRVNIVSLDKDHISICQLENRDEQLYKNILPFIEECLLVDDKNNDGNDNGDTRVKTESKGLSHEEMITFINSELKNLISSRLDEFFSVNANVPSNIIPHNFAANNELDRFKYCYKIIWKCAQTLTYPEFYQAWHDLS